MSARDNLPDQLQSIAALLPQLKTARAALVGARRTFDALNMRAGQECAHIHIAGRDIALTAHDRTYMPKPVAGRQSLLSAVIREQHNYVIECASKVEGLEFELRRLVKESA